MLDRRPVSGSLTADGPVLADAILAAARHTGAEPPFDRVVLAAEPTGLDVAATNTFTLFARGAVTQQRLTDFARSNGVVVMPSPAWR